MKTERREMKSIVNLMEYNKGIKTCKNQKIFKKLQSGKGTKGNSLMNKLDNVPATKLKGWTLEAGTDV